MRSGTYKETFADLVVLTDSRLVWLWTALLVGALITAPFVVNPYALSLLTLVLITLTGALGLNILTGMTGQISLGHAGFLILGAYAYAIPVAKWGWPPLLGFVSAAIVPALASIVVGLPSLRLRGLYLAITTLAFSSIVQNLILDAGGLTNGARGISVLRPDMGGLDLGSDAAFAMLCLIIAAGALLASLNIARSRVGRAFTAIRDNDIAARTMGISLPRYKLYAFMTGAAMTGIAGALMGISLNFVSVEGFPFLLSIEALAILVVGGLGSILGTVLGTVFIVLLPEVVSLFFRIVGGPFEALLSTGIHEVKSIAYGLAIILFLRLEPRGLFGLWRDARRLWINWPLRF